MKLQKNLELEVIKRKCRLCEIRKKTVSRRFKKPFSFIVNKFLYILFLLFSKLQKKVSDSNVVKAKILKVLKMKNYEKMENIIVLLNYLQSHLM